MTIEQQVIKQSDLINRLAIDRRTAEEVGRVEQLWLDPTTHQVVGLTSKLGIFGGKKQSFTWSQIESIGSDSIMLNISPDGVDPEKPERAISILGHEVWTHGGNKVGKLVDYLLLPHTGTVIDYLFSSNGWRGVMDGIYLLPATAISSVGSKRVIVADSVVEDPQKYAEGLGEKLKEDYEKTRVDFDFMKRKAQELAVQAKDKAQVVSEKTREGAQNFAEQARDRAQEVSVKAKEKFSEIKAKREEAHLPPDAPTTVDIDAEPLPPKESQAPLNDTQL